MSYKAREQSVGCSQFTERSNYRYLIICTLLLLILSILTSAPAFSERVTGVITDVGNDVITSDFPVPVIPRAMLMILSGEGEQIAGMAIAQKCEGQEPPYKVTGNLYLTMDAVRIAAGKRIYTNSINTKPMPSTLDTAPTKLTNYRSSQFPANYDLKLYYYAGGQSAGYGALGLGYERSIKVLRSLSLQIDGGVTGIGSVSAENADIVNTDQWIKSLNGRVKVDLDKVFGVYSGYRWNQGRADTEHWAEINNRLDGKSFSAASNKDECIIQTQGLEYGITIHPLASVTMMAGFMPKYRADFGSLGVIRETAYTAELRFGFSDRALRLRGLQSADYWIADLGITIQ